MNINTIKKIMKNSIDTANPKQPDILLCLAIIDECLEEIVRLRKVVDIAKDIEINLHNINFENQGTLRFNQLLKQTIGFNKILGKALLELEVNHE